MTRFDHSLREDAFQLRNYNQFSSLLMSLYGSGMISERHQPDLLRQQLGLRLPGVEYRGSALCVLCC